MVTGSTRAPWPSGRENYLRFTGIGDTIYFGPEAEFFIFDKVSFHNEGHTSGYAVDSVEGPWNTSSERGGSNGHGYHIRPKEGYVPLPPLDTISDLRSEIAMLLRQAGISVECHHHEVATGGQCEIDFRYNTLDDDRRQPDGLQVHGQKCRDARGQSGDLYAEAHLRRQRQRHALSPIDLESRASLFLRATVTRGCRRWRSTTSAGS